MSDEQVTMQESKPKRKCAYCGKEWYSDEMKTEKIYVNGDQRWMQFCPDAGCSSLNIMSEIHGHQRKE